MSKDDSQHPLSRANKGQHWRDIFATLPLTSRNGHASVQCCFLLVPVTSPARAFTAVSFLSRLCFYAELSRDFPACWWPVATPACPCLDGLQVTRTSLEADELVSSPAYDPGVFPALRARLTSTLRIHQHRSVLPMQVRRGAIALRTGCHAAASVLAARFVGEAAHLCAHQGWRVIDR